jgi:hypothetical protein
MTPKCTACDEASTDRYEFGIGLHSRGNCTLGNCSAGVTNESFKRPCCPAGVQNSARTNRHLPWLLWDDRAIIMAAGPVTFLKVQCRRETRRDETTQRFSPFHK